MAMAMAVNRKRPIAIVTLPTPHLNQAYFTHLQTSLWGKHRVEKQLKKEHGNSQVDPAQNQR